MEELFVFFIFFPLHRVWKRGEKKEKKSGQEELFSSALSNDFMCWILCSSTVWEARLKNEPSCGWWFHGPDLGLFYYTLAGSADIGGLVFFLLFFFGLMITTDLEVFNDIHMMFNYYPRCNRYTQRTERYSKKLDFPSKE